MKQNKWLLIGVVGAVGLLGFVWWQTQGQAAPAGAQNAVNPNAQIGAGATAQGTAPDIGNLLSYNQVPGVMAAPQLTSVNPFSSNYYNPGWTQSTTPASSGNLS